MSAVVDVSGSGQDAGLVDSAGASIAANLLRDADLYVNQVRADSTTDPTCPPVNRDLKPARLVGNAEVDEPARANVLAVADDELATFLDCARANPGMGSDVLGAILDAARHLTAPGERRLLVISDGHNNAAPLTLNREALSADSWNAEEVLQAVRDAGLLPDLSGVDVVFIGLGTDGRDQDPVLSERLRGFWTSYAEAAGAKSVTITHPAQEGHSQ